MLNVCKNTAILQYHITPMINKHWWEHFFPCQRLSSRLSYKTDTRPHWHSPDSANQHPTAGFLQCDHASPICVLAHYYLRGPVWFWVQNYDEKRCISITGIRLLWLYLSIPIFTDDSKETDHWQSHQTERDEKFTPHQQFTLLSEGHHMLNIFFFIKKQLIMCCVPPQGHQ